MLRRTLIFALVLSATLYVRGEGVTLITHGWNPSGGAPVWLESMRADIAENYLGNEQNYGKITVTDSGMGGLTVTCSPWDFDVDAGNTAEIIIVLDWSAVANHLTGGPAAQDVAAAVVDNLVTSVNGKRPLAELPIHLIGHSRGGGMVCELARLLGERGVVVDHVTPLDPHPLTSSDPQPSFPLPEIIDTPAAIYENVVFADVYSQFEEYPKGQNITGGYNREWTTLSNGYHDSGQAYASHRNVYLLYQGTIDLNNPVNNGEAEMDATERAAWFSAYENDGANAGFYYSRINGHGDRLSQDQPTGSGDAIINGMHTNALFGGNGERTNLTWNLAQWPNIAQVTVLSNGVALQSDVYELTPYKTQSLSYVYLDYDSSCNVMLGLDDDRNPYNGVGYGMIMTQTHVATGSTFSEGTYEWLPGMLPAGKTGTVFAVAMDASRTNYLYAGPSFIFGVPEPVSTVLMLITGVCIFYKRRTF